MPCNAYDDMSCFQYLNTWGVTGVKRKLVPRYVGPYKITERKGSVAYKLQLPPEMSAIFDVLHVSQLKRYLRIPEEAIAPTNIKLQSDLTYEEKPI